MNNEKDLPEPSRSVADKLLDYTIDETFDDANGLFDALSSERFRSGQWIFRGQERSCWELQPSLERFAKSIREYPPLGIEPYVRREFCRRAHQYSANLPPDDDDLEWLALMRHHGAPTRLLDFSKSPYIAAFFATAEAERDESSAIWAIDARALRRRSTEMLNEFIGTRHFFEARKSNLLNFSEDLTFKQLMELHDLRSPKIVVPVEPYRLNKRMLLQQGVFLCPGFIHYGFEESLASVAARVNVADSAQAKIIRRLVIGPNANAHVLRRLHQMNVNYASLFPDLDGLARSLATVSKIRAETVPFPQRPDWEFDSEV